MFYKWLGDKDDQHYEEYDPYTFSPQFACGRCHLDYYRNYAQPTLEFFIKVGVSLRHYRLDLIDNPYIGGEGVISQPSEDYILMCHVLEEILQAFFHWTAEQAYEELLVRAKGGFAGSTFSHFVLRDL